MTNACHFYNMIKKHKHILSFCNIINIIISSPLDIAYILMRVDKSV